MRQTYTISTSDLEESKQEGIVTGRHCLKPFVFGVLQVTDDDSSLNNPGGTQAVGEIRIDFYRASHKLLSQGFVAGPAPVASSKIHERTKKATPHRVEYGDEVQRSDMDVVRVLNNRYESVAQFVFRYTSFDMLKATGIVRPDPSSVTQTPATAECSARPDKRKADKEEELSDDDLDEEDEESRKREAELEAELTKLRKAREEQIEAELARLRKAREKKRSKKKVKRESRPAFGETIDLTL